jgi:hypothetical protein
MTLVDLTTRADERADVLEWRRSQLTRCGYPAADAATLAAATSVDLHAAADLVARGCPPQLAVRILL